MERRLWHAAYAEGVPPSLSYEELPLSRFVDQAAERFPDRPATIFLNGRLTYAQLKEEVDRLATALSALGVVRGSRVAIHLPNLPQTVIATMATLRLGGQCVMTNPLYVPPEVEHQWNDAGCTVAVTADFLYARTIQGIREKLPVKHYIIASVPEYLRFPLRQLAPLKLRKADPPLIAKIAPGEGIHFFRKLIRATPPNPPRVDVDMDEVAMLQYTGGTTGVSKGAMLTHRNLTCNVQQIRAWFPDLRPGQEVFLGVLPYFHIFGLTVSMLLPLYVAGAMVLMPNPRDIPAMIKGIAKHRVTIFAGVPAMFNAINNHPMVQKADLRSVKSCFSGSAPLPVEVLQRFEELTGSKIVEGYGLTEASPVTHVNPLGGVRKIGSIGIPLPDTDARIVDPGDASKEKPQGEEGELLIKGPQVMKGYWNRPDETAEVFHEGWLKTGDLAVMDEDGYFTIVGRKKDMILASGYNVYPDEIDRVLMAHPAVLEACTIGVPDPKRGETVKSFIVLKPGAQATEEEIIQYCRQHLAAYKVPKLVEFREELPKSSMLKLLRRVLREEELSRMSRCEEEQA
jgi:long-chain acyl-CoA synthetase